MKKIIFYFFSLLTVNEVYSQADTTTVIFFGKDRNKEKSKYHSVAVKAGIFDLVSGLYGIHLENELTSLFSIQAGGGATGRNFAYPLLADARNKSISGSSNNIVDGLDIEDEYYNYDSRKATSGYFFAIQPKIYFEDDGFEGRYIGFNFQKRRYNWSAQNVDTTSFEVIYIDGNDIKEFENQTIFSLTFGSQTTTDKAIFDYSVGIGYRTITGERRDLWYIDDGNFNQTAHAYINKVKQSELYFDISLKIGLYWSR